MRTLRMAAQGLKEILLPSLSRPLTRIDFPDTAEGARWG